MILPAPATVALRAHPDALALTVGESTYTYAQLHEHALQYAAALQALKTNTNGQVALRASAGEAFVFALHGCWLAGLVPVVHSENGMEASDLDVTSVAADSPPQAQWQGDTAFLVVHTSGSTGTPKACPLSYNHFLMQALGSASRLGSVPGDTWLNPLPPHTVGSIAILLRCALLGLTVDCAAPFDAGYVQHRLASGEVQLASLVPAMLERILDVDPDSMYPPQLRSVLCGGDRLPPRLAQRAASRGIPALGSWGMSESGAMLAVPALGDNPDADNVGYPLPFVQLRAHQGSLSFRLPWQEAWQPTRDCGMQLPDGRFRVTGRTDDTIISGGQNIDPLEIEQTLQQHKAVSACVVFGVPDTAWGSRPWALARVVDPACTGERLRQWLLQRLPARKTPDRIFLVDRIPHTTTGKISRRQLAADWSTETQ